VGTWAQFKSAIRAQTWPDGEAQNLTASHDKSFIDALIDIQTWVSCAQQNNTSLFPHCSTFYRCGLTVIDSAPRGTIQSVSVIDKINPSTGLEDAESPDDWCSEEVYHQVDACHVQAYLKGSNRRGCCLPIPLFFGLVGCTKGLFPVPTDTGLPAGLPVLPLGFHYPQTSTDRTWGRAGSGIWAMERGQIFIAPWINSTETVVIKWDGIKREWSDADPIDSDPLLSKAVRLYVQAQHAGEWDHEFQDEGNFQTKYVEARAMLIHQCREETRARQECGGGQDEGGGGSSNARAANGITDLFYNDDQSASVSCPAGTTGSAVSVTISAGTIGSAISKADANSKAAAQAQVQAKQQLVCAAIPVTYLNEPQTATESCTQAAGASTPDGTPVTVTVQAGETTSTVSQDAANATALALAQSRARAQLSCTFWNKVVTVTVTCPANHAITASNTVAAHVYSSTLSQADADAQANTAATNAANQALTDNGCVIAGSGGGGIFWNTTQNGSFQMQCFIPGQPSPPPIIIGGGAGGIVEGGGSGGIIGNRPCLVGVIVIVPAHLFSSIVSQADANDSAKSAGDYQAEQIANQRCAARQCGTFTTTYGGGFQPG
jgi:hypothetical protein